MTSQRAVDSCASASPGSTSIHGLHMISEDNRVRRGKTLFSNVLQGIASLPRKRSAPTSISSTLSPDVVISDFESWTYLYAKAHGCPYLSIDNMQVINRCKHPPELLEGTAPTFELTRAFVKSKLPFCDHYLITAFFEPADPQGAHQPVSAHPAPRDPRTPAPSPASTCSSTRPPRATAPWHRHAGSQRHRVPHLRHAPRSREDQVEGNLRFRPFSETTFIDDLRSAAAWWPTPASRSWARPSICTNRCSPSPSSASSSRSSTPATSSARATACTPPPWTKPYLKRFLAELPRFEERLSRLPPGRQPGPVRRPRPPPGPRRRGGSGRRATRTAGSRRPRVRATTPPCPRRARPGAWSRCRPRAGGRGWPTRSAGRE
jgi:hypothetical protein